MNLIFLAAAALIISAGSQGTGHHSNTHVTAAIQYSTYDRYGNELFVSLRSGDPYYGYDRFYYEDHYYDRCEPFYVARPVYLFHDPVFVVDRPVRVIHRPVYVREPVFVRRPVYVSRDYGNRRTRGDDRHYASYARVEVRSDHGNKSHGNQAHGGKGEKGKHGRG